MPDNLAQIEDFLINKIDKMLGALPSSAKKLKDLQMPLVRLKIENTGFPVIKSKKINDYFSNKLANPQDFL